MKPRLRKLHLDGREFTWKADIRAAQGPDAYRHRCVRVRVWGAGKNGRALQADLIERPGMETYAFPSAEDVRALASYGLLAGWTPESVGGTFRISAAAEFELPGFAVTDLLLAEEQISGGLAEPD
jgi:hypothetical protein